MQPMSFEFSIYESCALVQSLIARQDEQRDELGKKLQENISQLLASAHLLLDMARKDCNNNTGLLEKSLLCVNQAMTEINQLAYSLDTSIVDDTGLEAGVRQLLAAGREGRYIKARVDYDGQLDEALSPAQKLMVYRIVQEQMENIYSYADARCIHVALQKQEQRLCLSIRDDGKGFDTKRSGRGMGFIIINNRVASFDGSFELYTAPGKGCRLEIEVPLAA